MHNAVGAQVSSIKGSQLTRTSSIRCYSLFKIFLLEDTISLELINLLSNYE